MQKLRNRFYAKSSTRLRAHEMNCVGPSAPNYQSRRSGFLVSFYLNLFNSFSNVIRHPLTAYGRLLSLVLEQYKIGGSVEHYIT
jgi:hypothetical protein